MFVYRRSRVNASGVTALSRPADEAPHSRDRLLRITRHPVARQVAISLLVAVAAFLVLRGPSVNQGFSIDESRWIATSRYFWITLVERDLFGPDWQPNYLVYTHPPMARYLIGFGLWLQGWQPDQLNGRYDSLQSRSYNERAGNIPDLDLLWAARRVTLVFAVASVVLVYLVGLTLGGTVTGLAAVALVLVNPLLTTVWTRALAESIVAAFSLLALLLALRVMPGVGTPAAKAWLPLAIGAALALATATKLNGAIGALGMGMFAAIQQGQALLRTGRTQGLRSWVDVGMTAVVIFVAVNPLLYLMPADRIVGLVQHRQDEMQFQRSVFVQQAVPDDLPSRVSRVALRAFETHATPRGPLPLSVDVPLTAAGIGVLLWRSVLELRRARPGSALLFLCWLSATYAVVTPNLGFDSSHYFAPLVALNMVTVGVAIGAAANWLASLRRHVRVQGRNPSGQNVQAPTT